MHLLVFVACCLAAAHGFTEVPWPGKEELENTLGSRVAFTLNYDFPPPMHKINASCSTSKKEELQVLDIFHHLSAKRTELANEFEAIKSHLNDMTVTNELDHYHDRNISKNPFEKKLGSLFIAETYFEEVLESNSCNHVVLFGQLYMQQFSSVLDNYFALLDSCAVGGLSPFVLPLSAFHKEVEGLSRALKSTYLKQLISENKLVELYRGATLHCSIQKDELSVTVVIQLIPKKSFAYIKVAMYSVVAYILLTCGIVGLVLILYFRSKVSLPCSFKFYRRRGSQDVSETFSEE